MLDFLRKELVDTLYVSSIGDDLSTEKRVLINGREHFLEGYKPYAVACALVWKVPVSSSKQFKYAVHIGIAQQNQLRNDASMQEGVILAEERAYVEPSVTLVLDEADIPCIETICTTMMEAMRDDKFVHTEEETADLIKKYRTDRYTQIYPLDDVAFNRIKAFV